VTNYVEAPEKTECQQKYAMKVANRYEVIAPIASGGMATVYRGWDYNTRRYIAIKALRPLDNGSNDSAARERFRREAQAAARIGHPNVVRVYDFVEEMNRQFLIMEFVDGINLKRHIAEQGPLPHSQALAIAEQVCAALAAAHARGMIHRDIKPQNILLTPDNRVRLTDFGIVRVADYAGLTHSGIVLGTADYLAPEQARGDPLSPATDIYSLGIVLYEMITGEPPFKGTNPVSIAMQHASETVPYLRDFDPTIPSEIEAVLRQAVHKEARKRFQSAAMMARALRQCRHRLARQASLASMDSMELIEIPPRRSFFGRLCDIFSR
jgi:serine/threonine protein kinase